MNAGGHGSQTADVLVAAGSSACKRGGERLVDKSGLDLSYRHSSIGPGEVVTEATFRLEPGDAALAAGRVDEVVRWRREHQPGGQNAGSVFTNPPDDAAGRLIEAAGLKGLRIGLRGRVGQARQLHPGRSRRFGRRREASHRPGAALWSQERLGVELRAELRLVGFEEEP